MFEKGKANNYPIAVVDLDQSAISRQLIRWVDAGSDVNISNKVTSLEEGKRLIEQSKAYAVLYIPAHLEKSIYKSEAKPVILYYANDNISAGSVINSSVLTTVKTFSAGIKLNKRIANNETYEQALNNIQTINLQTHALHNPYINYSYYLVTGVLPVMLLMFIITTTIYVVGIELRHKTAEDWYNLSGNSVIVALTGKLLPYSFIFILEAILMNTLLFRYMGAPMEGSMFIITMASIFMVYAYQAVGVFIISVIPNVRLSLSLGAAYSSLAFSFSGLTFPLIAMDKSFQIFAYLFPYTHYLKVYINEAMKGIELNYSLIHFVAMAGFIAIPFFLIPRFRQFLTNPKYWGKQ
jgi:ABC-2 type transport system permease protein